jgi:hypothetical protein
MLNRRDQAMSSRGERTATGAAIGFGVVFAPGMILAAFAIVYAFAAALVGALIGAACGFFSQP